MSVNTALGRYFQLAPEQRKAHTKAEIRCAKRRCLLASVIEFEWNDKTQRVLLVQADTTNRLKQQGQMEGPNAAAPRLEPVGLTTEAVRAMSPGEVLDQLASGKLTAANLEFLFRNSGTPARRLAYVATAADFDGYSPNVFTRCDHVSGYLDRTHLNTTERNFLVDSLTKAD